MSLLQIVADVAVEVGLDEPASVFGNEDTSYSQIARFVQREGDKLASDYDWRALKENGVMYGDGVTTQWDLPVDFDRLVPGNALWIVGRPMWPVEGPISDEDMLAIQAGPLRPAYGVWRMFENQIEIYPTPADGVVYHLMYYRNAWVQPEDKLSFKTRLTLDTDIPAISERVLTLGAIWRWKRAKGLDYAEEFREYQIEKLKVTRNDGGLRSFRMRDKFDTSGRDPRRNAYNVAG
jgi:hypothetical protein